MHTCAAFNAVTSTHAHIKRCSSAAVLQKPSIAVRILCELVAVWVRQQTERQAYAFVNSDAVRILHRTDGKITILFDN